MWTRSIPAPELTLWRESGQREYRGRIRRRGDVAWTDLSNTLGGDWILGIRADINTPDQPAATFDLRLIRRAAEGTLSPGISAAPINQDAQSALRPLLHPGREVEVHARIKGGSYPWRLWLKGEVATAEWPDDEVLIRCRTMDGVLLRAQITEEVERGADDPGVPLAAEIQGLLNEYWPGADVPVLRVIGDPELGIGRYKTPIGSLGAHIRTLAQRISWDVRYLWSEPDQSYRLTLYLPPRDKTTPDFLLPIDEVADIPALSQSDEWMRNAIIVPYVTEVGGAEQRVVVEDAASIAEYRRQPMVVPISDGNQVPASTAQATAFGNYALHDLGRPLVEARYRHTRCLPWLELHDVIAVQADGARFDEDRIYSVVGGSHEVTADGEYTELELRGGEPTGQYFAWHQFAGVEPPPDLPVLPYLSKVRQMPGSDPLHVDLALTVEDPEGRAGTLRAWLSRSTPGDADPTGDPDGTLDVTAIPTDVGPSTTWAVSGGTAAILDEVRIHPGRGKAVFFEYVTDSGESTGVVRFTLRPTGGVVDEDGDIIPGIIDSEDLFAEGYSPVRVVGSQSEMDALPPSAQVATLGGKLYRRNELGEWTASVETVDLVGEIVANTVADGSITTAHFAAGIEPIHVETGPELPTEQITELVYWQGKLYRWDEAEETYEEYVAATGAITIVNTENIAEAAVTASKIAQQAVTTAKLAQEAVTADIIAAGAITAEKLLVGVGPNLIPNGDFRTGDVDGWRPVAGVSGITVVPRSETAVTEASGATHVLRFQRATSGNVGIYSHTTPQNEAFGGIRVRAGEQYRVGARYAMEDGTNPGTSSLLVTAYLDDGTVATVHNSGALPFATDWGHHTATVTMPPGAVKAHVYLRSQSMTGTVYWSDVRAEQVLSSGLIGDGAVTAGKIGEAAVGTAQIAERAVTDALIALEAVRAEHLQDASVGVAKFATGIRPVEIVSSLPASGNFPGRVVFLTTDGKIYRYGASGWTAEVPTSDLTGQIVAGQIAADAVGAAQLADGSLTVTKFASEIRPVEIVEELPVSGNTLGRTVFLTSDGKLYRYTASGWTAAVPTGDLVGQIGEDLIADAAVTADKIRDGAIGAGAFASGLRPIEIVGSLPASGNFPGRVVFLTADSKLYRYDGSQWTAAVPTDDLTGEIGEDLIADAAVTAEKIRSGAVGLAAFASGLRPVEVVSSLPTTGNTVGRTVFLTTTGKLHRYTPSGWTSAVPAADLSGQIGTGQIADAAITAQKIGDQAVSTAKIATGAVTQQLIASEAVIAEKLADSAVTQTKIAAGAVTTAKLDALAVTAAKIAAGAVEAQHITAGSVTTEKIEAGAVTAAQIAAGAVTTGKLDALAVTADKLAANAVTAGKLAANAVTAGTIAADAITAGTIAAGAVGAEEIAAGAVQAEHIRVGSRILPLSNPSVTGSADGWPLGVVGVTNRFGSTVTALESETDANLLRFSDWIDIDPTKTYEVRASLRSIQGHSGATDGGILYFGLQAENASGSIIAVTPFDPATRAFGTATDNPYFWSGGLGSGAWRDMVGYVIGANADAAEVRAGKNVTSHFRLPPTAQRIRLRWLNWSNGGVTRRAYLWSPTLTPVDATLIHGDGIVANSITTNKLAFEVVGSTNVIASINASTEGLRIQADRIRIDGDVQFGPGYDPTTKETPSGAQAKADAARDAAVSTAASDAAAKAAAAQSAAEATAALLAEQEAEAARLAAIDAASGDASAKAAAAQSAAEATAALLAEQEAEAARLAAIAASLDKETYLTAGTTTIEGGKITTGSIAADRLAVNSAMVGMLNAGVVRAQDIQARAIGVEHLRIGSPALPLANPSITDDPTLGWSVSGGGTVSMADGIVRGGTVPRVVRFRSTGDSMYTSDMIEVDPTRTYEVRASLRAHQEFPGSPGARVYFGAVVYDGTGNRIDAATYSVASRTWSSPVNSPYFWTDALPTGAYRDMTAYLLGYGVQEAEVRQGRNVTSHVRLPASAKYVQIRFLSWGNAGTARNLDIYSPTITPVDATLIHGDGIVAGSITTSKLAFTPLGSDNVVAAINASTEGLRIQADRIRIDGDVQFGPGYDPTTKETPQGAQDKANAAQDAAVAASLDKETYLTPGTTTIAGGLITTGSITADQIAANTITAGQIASGAVTADEIAANAVTAGKILAGAIGTDHLAAEAVTTAKLDALAVTADKLAASAVTAGKIAADAVTAGTIAAGAIGADEIAARVINSEHLRIGSLALPLANPSVTGSADGWPLGVVDVTNRHGATVTALMSETDANLQRFSEWIEVDPTKTYEVRASLRSIQGHSGAADGGVLYFGVQAENAAGALVTLTPFSVATREFAGSTTTNGYFWSGGLGSGAWRDVVGYILGENVVPADVRQGKNATSHFRLPATTRRVRLQWLNWNNGGTTRRAFLWSPTITPVDATLIHGTGIVTGSITADQIGANAITAAKILAGEIDTLHLASGAVTTAKLEAGSVTTSILAAEAVVAEKIAAGAIETEKLAANSVVASKIATGEIIARHILAGAIEAEKIASGAVTTEKLDAEAVTAAKIAALAVESDKIAANAIQAGHISAGSIQSDHLVSDAVTAGKIAAGAVSADQIAANAITTPKLHAEAVTAEKIAANAITAEKIHADAVTADKIATNAVTADALDANSVTAAAILAGSVTADKIAANAITAGKLAIGWTQGASLNSDPGTTDAGAWRTQAGAAGSVVDVGGAGRAGRTALRSVPDGGQWYVFSERVPVESTKTYRASAWARASTAAANGTFYLVVRLLDGALNPIDGDGAGYWFYPRPAIALGTSFEFFQGVFGADTARPIPVSAKYMQIGAFLNAGGTTGSYQMQGVRLEEVIPSVLIKDGAITAAKIRAGAVTADKIDVSDLSAINATFSGDVKLYNQENLLEAYVNDQLEAALVPNRFSIFPPPWQGSPYNIDGVQLAHVNGAAVGVYDDGYVRVGETNDWGPLAPWQPAMEIQTATVTTAGDTAMVLSYHNGTNQRLMRVTVGAPDSGGAGFRVLRVPN